MNCILYDVHAVNLLLVRLVPHWVGGCIARVKAGGRYDGDGKEITLQSCSSGQK